MEFVTSENKKVFFTENEIKEIRKLKVATKISDTDYITDHPEINLIIKELYKKVL